MSEMACPSFTDCLCPQTPFRNFSAEAPDPALQFAFVYVEQLPQLGDPDNFWGGTAIPAGCERVTSQDAVDCATRTGEELIVDEWRTPDGGPVPLYGNSETTCFTPCPNGDLTEFMIPAGTVVARTQAAADVIAASKCQFEAAQNLSCPPSVETLSASDVEATTATLNAIVNPNGSTTTYYFEWGTTLAYGNTTSPTALNAGSEDVLVAASISGLTNGTLYHFRIVAINNDGTSFGGDETFQNQARTIDQVGLDNAYDFSRNAAVIAGDFGGAAAYFKDGIVTTLPIVPGTTSGAAFAVSPNGRYLTGDNFVFPDDHGIRYDITLGVLTDLPTLLGSFSIGFDVSDDGFVLTPGNGVWNPNTNNYLAGPVLNTPQFAFYPNFFNASHQWTVANGIVPKNVKHITGAVGLNITPAGADLTSASNVGISINNAGHVAGTFKVLAGDVHSFLYNGVTSTDIGNLGGFVNATQMNSSDVIVGQAFNLGGGISVAFKWSLLGGISIIPTLPGPGVGIANDINDAGNIVGEMDGVAFVFQASTGGTSALTDFLPMGSGWSSLENAIFINNNNQIVGLGTFMGTPNTIFLFTIPDL